MPDADKDDAIIVAVTRDGNIFLGNDQMSPDGLTNKVKDLISNRLDKTVYIRADGRAKYGDVANVVDEIRSAGVDKVGMETERIERSNAPPPPPSSD